MKSPRNRPIGVFDSGVGGLTVVKSLRKYLPEEDIVYFGDTARVPYGNKSRSTIIRFSHEIMRFLLAKNIKIAVVACNTASSLSLGALRSDYSIPVIGVIDPGAKEALSISKTKRVGVIGTNSTVSSMAYDKELKKLDKRCKVYSKSCPLFVPLVENRFISNEVTFKIAGKYLKELKNKKIDSLILGCTHYPLLKGVIGRIMVGVRLVDSSIAVAKSVKETLSRKGLEAGRKGKGKVRYYVSDDPDGFSRSAGIFLKEKIKVSKVNI